jgi:hypothetical protein
MKKVLLLLSFIFVFVSCTIDPVLTSACADGNCDGRFWVDTSVNPGSYQDTQGVWHVKFSGRTYFTLKGSTDELTQEYVVNGVPLMETAYDSNFFFTTDNVQWTYPVYSFLGLYTNNNLHTAIPYGYITQTIPQIQNSGTDITNLVGYQITPHTTFDKPYSSTLLQVYSKYNSHPQHSMIFLPSFVGKTAEIYVRVMFGERLDQVREYKIKVAFEN